MAANVEEAEKAYKHAEERFLAGDVAGAIRSARGAKRLFPLLPALGNALAAYEVHAAAAARGGENWYAVLGLAAAPAGSVTHDAVKAQYRRLCLVLHPDKNRSAAADGAFKLLGRAWEELCRLHPPGNASAAGLRSGPAPRPWASEDWWGAAFGGGFGPPPHESGSFDDDRWWTPPPERDWSSFDWKTWRARYAKTSGTIYCGNCRSEFVPESEVHGEARVERCRSCGEPFIRPPRQSKPAATAPPPPPPPGKEEEEMPASPPREVPGFRSGGGRKFPCPGQCPRCEAAFSSQKVSVGMWHLTCKACSYYAMVHVRSPDMGTTF
ncbi:hypothetical protein ACP70R_025797 [Stipagrostis hirtigluma subsp. patula]